MTWLLGKLYRALRIYCNCGIFSGRVCFADLLVIYGFAVPGVTNVTNESSKLVLFFFVVVNVCCSEL